MLIGEDAYILDCKPGDRLARPPARRHLFTKWPMHTATQVGRYQVSSKSTYGGNTFSVLFVSSPINNEAPLDQKL